MNILMLYPEFPDTFWSYKHALRFVGKRAALPPLGLITVASLLPKSWDKRLVDLNVDRLQSRDLKWADCAYISGMSIQKDAAQQLIKQCKASGLKIIAGGPLFTMDHESFAQVDHFILNEAEITLPLFLQDHKKGKVQHLYTTNAFPDISTTPPPQWELLNMKRYHSMEIQYSRGCPFNCDFCNVTSLLGHKVRIKTAQQIITELDGLYATGWRDGIFFVDDNFIGNKRQLKEDLLPQLIRWRKNKQSITFQTEASINLADDPDLMNQMVDAGFDTVFVGIETPDEGALAECNKTQNANRDLVADVKRLQQAGLQVQGGFIVGFDSDNASIFRRQIDFIQRSGIVTAMVGLLQAPKGTKLYQRMEQAGRLTGISSGDNVEGTTNITPIMDASRLHAGYKQILNHIYAPKHYYARIKTLLRECPRPNVSGRLSRADLMALLRSIFRLGIIGKERVHYWKLLVWTCLRRPRQFHLAVTLAISGYHFRKVCEHHVH